MNLEKLKIEKITSFVLGVAFSILYGVIEYFFVTKYWSFENPFTKVVFWKFTSYHIFLMLPTFTIISFRPFIDEIVYYIKYRHSVKTVVDLVIYGFVTLLLYLMIEDITWHFCWWFNEPSHVGEFCVWTLMPFTGLKIPWWYIVTIFVIVVYVFMKKFRKCL